jgi:hypothetical protein
MNVEVKDQPQVQVKSNNGNDHPAANGAEPTANVTEPIANVAEIEATQATENIEQRWYTKMFTALLYIGIVLTLVWFFGARQFLLEHKTGVVIAVVAILASVAVPTIHRGFARTTSQRRIGLIIFSLIPVIAFFVIGVFIIKPIYQAALLRTIFLVIVCSLPALMFYLFIATKKYSLLNEFVINLDRLGLLDPNKIPAELVCAGLQNETEAERKNRIYTYIQKFESVYGAIPTDLGGLVVEPTDTGRSTIDLRMSKVDPSGFANIFTIDTTVPVILSTVLIALGWLITLPPWQGQLLIKNQNTQTSTETQGMQASGAGQDAAQPTTRSETDETISATEKWLAVFTPITSPVRFAFIGAYFFSLQLLFRRYVRRDLRASAYVAVALRVILAFIGIWVVVEAVGAVPATGLTDGQSKESIEKLLLVLGFVIGVFPRVAWQVVQTTVKRFFSIVVPSLQTQLPLSDLDGLTVWHEARFEEEDIENIPNMATADLVDLLINTRFPPDRIIDWMDQAILYTHLGPEEQVKDKETRREILRAHGIRTAAALVDVYNKSAFHKDQDAFEKILPGDGRNTIRSLADAVETNPNLKLIQTWRGLLPHTHETPQELNSGSA